MRDLDRIDRIVGLISKLWHLYPDLRLGQLLYNYAGFGDGNYHLEDEDTEQSLAAFAKLIHDNPLELEGL